MSAEQSRRGRVPGALVLVVAVAIGVAGARFAGEVEEQAPPPAVQVAAAADLSGRIAQLERAVAADPDDLTSLRNLGSAYVDRAAETGDPAFYDLSQQALDQAAGLAPDDPQTVLVQGLLALSRHEFTDALALGTKAREQLPDSPDVLGVVVDAQVELGRYDEAGDTLQQMLDRRPGLPALARASYQRELAGDLPGAVAAMQQAAAAGSASSYSRAQVDTLLGDLLYRTGDLDAAGRSYDAALRAAPELVLGRLGSARVQAAQGDLAGATAGLEESTARRPTVATLTLLEQLQRTAGADVAADETAGLLRALGRLQEDAGQVVDLEMALFEADQPVPDTAVALRYARSAYDARPDNVFTADALGWALLRAGRPAEALPLVEQALRRGSADPLLRYHAAEVLAAVGDLDRARTELDRVAASPWFSFGHLRGAGALAARLGVPAPPAWT